MPLESDAHGIDEYLPILRSWSEGGVNYLVIAGQAVNMWAARYESVEPALSAFRPYVSKDLDLFLSGNADLVRIKALVRGKLTLADSPADGQWAIFESANHLRIDLFHDVPGISVTLRGRLMRRALQIAGIPIMDPVFLLAVKARNVRWLPQERRNDRRHVQMLALAVRCYLAELIDAASRNEITERQCIDDFKALLELRRSSAVRDGLKDSNIALVACIPWEKVASCTLPKLIRFHDSSLRRIRHL